ncbi:MAG: hypothetical protein AABO41_25660 [Acidobacteriota bacterium]
MRTEQLVLILMALQTLIFGLTFVGLVRQLRRINQSMRNDAYSKAIDDYYRITQLLLEKPSLNRIFYSANASFKSLDSDQQDFYNYLALSVGFLERIYLLFKQGLVDRGTWESWERWLTLHWFQFELFDLFWKNERTFFSADFCQYVDDQQKDFATHRTA